MLVTYKVNHFTGKIVEVYDDLTNIFIYVVIYILA